jgi:FtsZ-interacting cell division protein ZipA
MHAILRFTDAVYTRGLLAIERKGGITVDSGQLIGIIVGVVVVIAIVVVAVMLNRRRKVEADRNKAVEMREQAKSEEIGAREREAQAARAEADAKQAEVEAERLREEARERQQEAEHVRAGAQEQLRKADELDPDVVTTERDAQGRGETPREAGVQEELRRDRSDRTPPAAGQTSHPDGSQGSSGQVPQEPVRSDTPPADGPRTDDPRTDNPRNL